MHISIQTVPSHRRARMALAVAALCFPASSQAIDTNVTINGTSGSTVNSSTLSTGNAADKLNISLGFFMDYLIVAGGGGGGGSANDGTA